MAHMISGSHSSRSPSPLDVASYFEFDPFPLKALDTCKSYTAFIKSNAFSFLSHTKNQLWLVSLILHKNQTKNDGRTTILCWCFWYSIFFFLSFFN